MSDSNRPDQQPEESAQMVPEPQAATEPGRKFRLLAVFVAILCVAAAGEGYYAWRLSRELDELKTRFDEQVTAHEETLAQLNDRLGMAEEGYSALRGEVSSTQQRLGSAQGELQRARQMASQLAQQQKETAEVLSSRLGQIQQEQEATKGAVGSISSDVSGVRQEVAQTKQELASTVSQLQRVIGDLGVQSDLIARNREELAELRALGTRDYYEFDLRKSKQPQRVGNIGVLLRKTDVKRQKYTFNLIADDRTIEKKDKTVNEPVQFYQDGFRQPTEIVVNQVYKDRIVGYISVPKQKESRLSAGR